MFNQEGQNVGTQVNISDPNANYTGGKVSSSQPIPTQIIAADSYQEFTAQTDLNSGLEYLLLGLTSEVGELAAIHKRIIRDGDEPDMRAIKKELGDILWYVTRLCAWYGFKLSDVMHANIAKLWKRDQGGTIKGKGDNR